MSLPNTFATESGNVPASQLDVNFNAVGNMGGFACAASGNNTITLIPSANQPVISAYFDFLVVKFVVPATTTAAVNMGINLLADVPVYNPNGTQAGSGDLVIGNVASAIYSSTLNSGGGGFMLVSSESSGAITLPAGTALQAPLTYTSGINKTTASAGSSEYDGKVLYFTPQGQERGLIDAAQQYTLTNATNVGANASTAQSVLGVGVSLSVNTVYQWEAGYFFNKSAGASSHTVGTLFGLSGGLSTGTFVYECLVSSSTIAFNSGMTAGANLLVQAATSQAITGAIASANSFITMKLRGIIVVANPGILTPQYILSAAPGGAYTVALGSFFKIWPINTNTGNNQSIGTWA